MLLSVNYAVALHEILTGAYLELVVGEEADAVVGESEDSIRGPGGNIIDQQKLWSESKSHISEPSLQIRYIV